MIWNLAKDIFKLEIGLEIQSNIDKELDLGSWILSENFPDCTFYSLSPKNQHRFLPCQVEASIFACKENLIYFWYLNNWEHFVWMNYNEYLLVTNARNPKSISKLLVFLIIASHCKLITILPESYCTFSRLALGLSCTIHLNISHLDGMPNQTVSSANFSTLKTWEKLIHVVKLNFCPIIIYYSLLWGSCAWPPPLPPLNGPNPLAIVPAKKTIS